jgi:GTPase SAR1 family protein
MARKYGKKTVVKIDPLAYNIGLFGSGGWGKTSLMIEFCERLVSENGYIHANIGREKGVDTINGAVSEDIKSWSEYKDMIEDIIENKETDYKDLRVVLIDTIDELAVMAEKEAIRQHNLKNPTKKTDSLNIVGGGFGAGNKILSEIILKSIDDLRDVGVNVIIIGHTKLRTKIDVMTGEEYDVVTSKITDRLFTDIKTKLDVLGIGIVKRNINNNIVGKDIMGKDRVQKLAESSERVITFRSDGDVIDSKSRFADIDSEIPFGVDNLINTLNEAIRKAFEKKKPANLTMEKAKQIQDKEQAEKVQVKLDEIKAEKSIKEQYGDIPTMIDAIKTFYLEKATDEQKDFIKGKLAEFGVSKFDMLADCDLEQILSILEITK